MSIDTNMKTTSSIYTLKYYSATKQNEIIILAAAWMNQEIIILCKVSQRQTNILRYHVQVGSIKSHQWTETAWENQILIIKKKVRRDKLNWDENIHMNKYQVDNEKGPTE